MNRAIIFALVASALWSFGFYQGESKERTRWSAWSGENVAWQTKSNRIIVDKQHKR